MHLEMPGEKLNNNYESLTNDEIRKQLDVLKGQMDAMNKVLEQRGEKGSSQGKADKSGNSDLNVDNIRLYMWGGKEKLEKSGVLDVIKSLKEPHKSKISEFIKSNQVGELQKYLNGQIDSKAIDQSQLESTLAQKRIWLRSGHLMEDGKFGPQTFETIKFLANLPAGGESGSAAAEKSAGTSAGNVDAKKESQVGEANEVIETLGGKKCRKITINSVDSLPSGYKRKDPENYDPSNKNTYPIIYRIKQGNIYIKFYSNGRCAYYGDMCDTKDVVERLKNGRADDEKYGNDLYLHMQSISDLLKGKEFLIGGKKDTIGASLNGNKIRFYLNSGYYTTRRTSQGYYVGTTQTTSTTNYEFYKDLSAGDLLDQKGKFDKNYFQNVVLIKVKKDLESQYKANSVVKGLLNVRKKGYSMTDIFGNEHDGETKYLKYFQKMDSSTKKITFDDIRRDGTNIKFSLDNDGSNEDYNKLSVKYTELADNNGNFSEKKLKQYLKKKVKEIIDKNF